MKIITLALLLSICLSAVSSGRLGMRRSAAKEDPYTILVLGDIGQVDQFEPKSIQNTKPKTLSDNDIKDIKGRLIYAKPDGKYDVNKPNCQVDSKDLTFSNFSNMLTSIKKLTAHESVILGDALYTEAKNIGKLYAKAAAVAKGTDAKSLQELLVDEFKMRLQCGWTALKAILASKDVPDFLKKEKTVIIFGNHSMDVDYNAELAHLSDFIPPRVLIERKKQEATQGLLTKIWSYFNKKVIAARNLEAAKRDLTEARVTRGIAVEKTISEQVLYIDIDMSKLVCADQFAYDKNGYKDPTTDEAKLYADCLDERFISGYPGYVEANDRANAITAHKKYFYNLMSILKALKLEKEEQAEKTVAPKGKDQSEIKTQEKEVLWKVVRVHQPVFNIEADWDGVKKNAALMKAFKKASIHLWFTSHHHTAEINLARYETLDKDKKKTYEYKNFDLSKSRYASVDDTARKEVNVALNDKLTNIETTPHTALTDFFFTQDHTAKTISLKNPYKIPETINRCSTLLKTCTDGNKGTLYIKKDNNDYIIQLLSGNGGRKLDSLLTDNFSDSYMLYGRSKLNEYGFYTVTFTSNQAVIEFRNGDTVNFTLTVVQDDAKANDAGNFAAADTFTKALTQKYNWTPVARKLMKKK